MDKALLRCLPRVDGLLAAVEGMCGDAPRSVVTEAVRGTLDELRGAVLLGEETRIPDERELCERVVRRVRRECLPSLRGVINATGVVLHTNLGRACLSERAAAAAAAAAAGYSTLEYDARTGGRGWRGAHVEPLLCRLTGAESALVVNNNAAAVLLMLTALASGGEVIVSRGELVEIGGSFRIPDIMAACGAALREVGTTNRTRVSDYAAAVCGETCALLKVHTSNYRIVGFTESVSREELAALGRERGLPVLEDLGSGSLAELERFGIRGDPTLQDSVRAGVDVTACSGDKLLGGPQAGIIVGRKKYLDILKSHPLARALRADKMTLAALEMTLRSYAEGRAEEELPVLSMLAMGEDELRARAWELCEALRSCGAAAEVVSETDQVGGGSVPGQPLPSFAVALDPGERGAAALERALRSRERPVVARVAHGRLLLGVRTLRPGELAELAEAVAEELR